MKSGPTPSCFVVLGWLMLMAPVWAGQAAADGGGAQLERFLQQARTLRADFVQTTENQTTGESTVARGRFLVQRPARFRWDYAAPFSQQIIADGTRIWLYDPELEQVSVQYQDSALEGTPALLLASGSPVARHFEQRDIGGREELEWVELIPKSTEGQFEQIRIGLADDLIGRMELVDRFGHLIRFSFSNVELNPGLDPALFAFTPPEGYEIFHH